MERVEDRLIRDLARQTDMRERTGAGVRAHERTPPVRRCARDVRRAACRDARQIITGRLVSRGQHERSAAQDRTKENLEAAVSANVVEGAPYRTSGTARGTTDRRRQAVERVHDQ